MKTIYKNGAVYTGKLPLVEAFAVEDGKFVFAGSSAEADALAAAGDKVVDSAENSSAAVLTTAICTF